jgi:hypothetical protein
MIDVSEMIHDPDFEQQLTIERTSNGHFEKSAYKCDTVIILLLGIMVNPKNSKEIVQTEQGDQATGYVDVYVDKDADLYVTREKVDEKNISDIIITGYGTDFETRYRVTNTYDKKQWGFLKASAVREGAL